MSTDNLQQAIANAAAEVRARHPELSEADVAHVFAIYREHFEKREDDPPVSTRPAEDNLLLAIWDVIVDRETDGLDQPDGDLEQYYADAFAQLLGDAPDTDYAGQPVAMSVPPQDAVDDPAPVGGEPDDAGERFPSTIDTEYTEPEDSIYKLRISLDGSDPEIWREMLVPDDVVQGQLHHYIQAAMGWPGSDDFQFLPPQGATTSASGDLRLRDLLPEGKEDLGYEFDHWYHHVSLLSVQRPQGREHYPVCTAGRGACPPPDTDMKEYNRQVRILQDPADPDHEEVAGWVTQDFNPGAFSVDQANQRLGRYGDAGFRAVV